jgi:hypothetical protein
MSSATFAARALKSCVLVMTLAASTLAAERSALAAEDADGNTIVPEKPKPEPDPFRTRPGYVQIFLTTFFGDGLRFNNPYRLSTPLGSNAESVSRTAPYIDLGLGATFGNPLGFQHGAALRTSAALSGVGQVVMTPSYLGYRRWSWLALYGRAGRGSERRGTSSAASGSRPRWWATSSTGRGRATRPRSRTRC